MPRAKRNALREKGQIQKELVHYNVFRLKKEVSLSNAEFANLLGFSPTTVAAWEKGSRGITLKALSMISEVLNVDISEFYKPRTDDIVVDEDPRKAKLSKLQSLLYDYSLQELDHFIDTVTSINALMSRQTH
ncbi:MAG: helix-turn-helix domain-containing protein [Defluviitaleaceae bacterium]|nr:helix-turn-helix domain-containing protein [Defluviitaleaceae bacterium]